MIDLPYSLVIEATEEPDFFGFYSPELEGFTGVGHSVEDWLTPSTDPATLFCASLAAANRDRDAGRADRIAAASRARRLTPAEAHKYCQIRERCAQERSPTRPRVV